MDVPDGGESDRGGSGGSYFAQLWKPKRPRKTTAIVPSGSMDSGDMPPDGGDGGGDECGQVLLTSYVIYICSFGLLRGRQGDIWREVIHMHMYVCVEDVAG